MTDNVFNTLKEVINICETEKISYWIVGGFAVDAKKGFLSREHGDIDLCIHQDDMKKCLKFFYKNGFKITKEGLNVYFCQKPLEPTVGLLFDLDLAKSRTF